MLLRLLHLRHRGRTVVVGTVKTSEPLLYAFVLMKRPFPHYRDVNSV